MATLLNQVELRVLGVLMEKSLAQPGSYPLTLNAILLGANQKQNRDPVLELTEADVAKALHTLEQKQLTRHAAPASGVRANRFEHVALDHFGWDQREQAVMAELILRGRQTSGELRTRASRMTTIPDLEAIAAILEELMSNDPPFVEELPREPGRSANRFRHLLSAEPTAEPVPRETELDTSSAATNGEAGAESLNARVARLEEQVARLTEVVADLRRNRGEVIDAVDSPPV